MSESENLTNPDIPFDIKMAISRFPPNKSVKIRPGPTFIEFTRSFPGIRVGLLLVAFILFGIGIGIIIGTDSWFGILFIVFGVMPFVLYIKTLNNKVHLFVIDYETQMVYSGDKDIPNSMIDHLQIVQKPYILTDYEGGSSETFIVFGLMLISTDSKFDTMIFRFWSTDREYWTDLGIYFQEQLSAVTKRSIFCKYEPKEVKFKEKCAYLLNTKKEHHFIWA